MEENMNVITNTESEKENVLKVLEQAADEMDETDDSITGKRYEWSIDTTTVRSLLKKQKEGKLQLPLCQRLYVWNADQRKKLMETVRLNRPCGVLELAEVNGIQYLVDGLQRLTSLMYLSMDYDDLGLDKDQKKMVLDYRIPTIVTKEMDIEDTKEFFNIFNSGVALASAVKYRSTLSNELNDAILSLASKPIFRNTKTKGVFKKGHHHELIAENALLAAAGLPVGGNKAKEVCERLAGNEEKILENFAKAELIIGKIEEIYREGIEEEVVGRSFTANFLSILCYVISNNSFGTDLYRRIINHIFAARNAIRSYTVTTTNGAADATKCKNRYDMIVFLLNNPPAEEKKFKKEEYEAWASQQKIIKDTSNEYVIDFHDIKSSDKEALYMAQLNCKSKDWNTIVEKVYKDLEDKGIKEAEA